jgi:flagellar export protein FliJ
MQFDEAILKKEELLVAPPVDLILQLDALDQFADGQKIRIARQREVIINHTTIVEQKQEILVAAAKETKILERLKEKQMLKYKKERQKQEAKANDELVVTRFRQGDER